MIFLLFFSGPLRSTLSTIWESDLTDNIKREFFQAVAASVLLYGCTTWTLTKRLENKLDGSCTRMLRAALNKSWKQHTTQKQLYGHLLPITHSTGEDLHQAALRGFWMPRGGPAESDVG